MIIKRNKAKFIFKNKEYKKGREGENSIIKRKIEEWTE